MSLPYLDMVVSEILRMYPPLPFLDRITKETYKVPNSDLVLEKGTPIYISLLGVHYDPEYYPNPDKFDPERFTKENKRNRSPYVYLPFGDGPRMCIGKNIGCDRNQVLTELYNTCIKSRMNQLKHKFTFFALLKACY